MKDNIMELSKLPIFYGIKKEDLPAMLQCLGSYEKQYAKNEIIFLESCEIRSIGIILSGTVHMIKEDIEGSKTLIVCMKAGELFGETFSCGTQTDAKVSFLASTACRILFLPFYRVIHSCKLTCTFHHRLIENMIGLISNKNIQLMEKVEIISKKSLREKIICYLRVQEDHLKMREFEIPLGRLELADYLCADRSALTRELNSMQKEGLIRYRGNWFKMEKI